jgi:DNA-binding CsgD family transcriptional regulator
VSAGVARNRSGLIERQGVLAEIDTLVWALESGTGGTLLIEAAPGLGKTEVLAAATVRARMAGVHVRGAQGGELEQTLGWGIARELLTGPARDRFDRIPEPCAAALGLGGTGAAGDPVAIAHGLSELCADLSAEVPLALIVDDAHWADPVSVRWLAYLAPRARELAVLLILAARPHDPRRPGELTTLAARDGVTVRQLAALSKTGGIELVRRSLPDADDVLCDACYAATGGNAFLLTELMRELSAGEDPLAAMDVAEIEIGRIDRMLARRLAAAGADAERLARAAAVFGAGTAVADVAAVAELDPAAAARAADGLSAADVVAAAEDRRLAFIHPLVHAAVQRLIAPGERSQLHLRAARQLELSGAPVEQVGAHLLAAEPGSEQWVRQRLIAAGDAALAAGALRNAVALYERAAAERVAGRDPVLLAKLGRAAMGVNPPAAEGPLRSALTATADPVDRVPLALDLAVVLQTVRRPEEAVAMLDALGSELRRAGAPRPLQLRVEAELLAQSFHRPQTWHLRRARLPQLAGTLTGENDEEALIVVQQAVEAINTGTAAQVRELAQRAWLDGRLGDVAGSLITPAVMWIPYIRMYVDDYDWTIAVMHEWLKVAQRNGSSVLAAFANCILADAQWRAGALRDAEGSAQAAWEIARELGSGFPGWWIAIGALAQAMVATGSGGDAAALLRVEGVLGGPPPELMLMPLPRAVRAEVLVASGALEQGVRELDQTREWVDARHEPSPGAWRFYATLVDGLLALDRHDEAAEVARGWLRRTRAFGCLSTRGIAERALALTTTGDAQLDGLRRAERTLAQTPARAEHARALLELGAALRRARRRADAREPLRRALDLATRCGAEPLAERARVELLASGGRPRRAVLTGAEALTASERRIAQLAGDGLTNREIAAALFISRKTVERHLGNIYVKLGTSDRRALPAALAAVAT